jgi:hypothetical protein
MHGVRDFHYEWKQSILFVISSDMNIASRMDSYLTNMKMPWEKEAMPTLLSVGGLECFFEKQDGSFEFERIWSKTYPV